MTHPQFEFLLSAWAFIRAHGLEGEWRPVKVAFKEWRLERVV